MTNHTILITGGSSGIGLGIAGYYYKKGWQVIITGRNKEKLHAVKKSMPKIHVFEYHSSEKKHIEAITQFIKEHCGGRLDILVNSAGGVLLGALKDIKEQGLEAMYTAHVKGPALVTAACLDFLITTRGHILNITSSHGIKAYAELSAYGAAKAALNMLTKIWALELAPYGIKVNAIAPGPTNTEILASAGYDEATVFAIKETERRQIPLQRRGDVEDIVLVAVSVLSSEWTSGVILPVDGGISVS